MDWDKFCQVIYVGIMIICVAAFIVGMFVPMSLIISISLMLISFVIGLLCVATAFAKGWIGQ